MAHKSARPVHLSAGWGGHFGRGPPAPAAAPENSAPRFRFLRLSKSRLGCCLMTEFGRISRETNLPKTEQCQYSQWIYCAQMPKPSGIVGMHLRVVQKERLPAASYLRCPVSFRVDFTSPTLPFHECSSIGACQSGQLRSTAGQCAGLFGVLSDMVETVSDWEFLHCLRFCTAMAALFNVQYVSRQKAQSATPVCLPKSGIMRR